MRYTPKADDRDTRAVLEHYAETYCEGWCERDYQLAQFDPDCGGCLARRAQHKQSKVVRGKRTPNWGLAQALAVNFAFLAVVIFVMWKFI